jgi:hypothetical protein
MHEPLRDDDLIARPAFPREAELVIDLAHVGRTRETKGATATRDDAFRDTPVSRRHLLDISADRLDRAGPLVPERERVVDVGRIEVAPKELEVGSTDATERGPDHDLARARLKTGSLSDRDLARFVHDERTPRHRANHCKKLLRFGCRERSFVLP